MNLEPRYNLQYFQNLFNRPEFSTLLAATNDGVVFQKMDGTIVYFNERALEILELTENELLGRTSYDPNWQTLKEDDSPFPPEEHPMVKTLKTGESIFDVVMKISVREGHFRYISINTVPFWEGDSMIGAFGNFTDITDEKIFLNQLKVNEEKYRFLFDNSNDMVCTHSTQGLYTAVSNKSEQILGITPEELIGHVPVEFIYTEDIETYQLHFSNTVKKKVQSEPFTYRHLNKTGEYIWLETIVSPVMNQKRHLTSLITSTREVNQMKLYEAELQKLNNELERSNSELTDFAYVASHDLQEPLRMVSSFSELLKRDYREQLDETGKRYIDYTIKSAKRMRSMIQDLLEYSRLDAHGQTFEWVETRLLFKNCTENLKTALTESHGKIEITSKLPLIKCNKGQMERVFQNMLSNALKYRRPDRDPVIEISFDGNRILIIDNGIGIDEAYSSKIFKIFQRLHGQDEYDGTGIGLSICKRIVEQHAGQIGVFPNPQGGSIFYIELPQENIK